MLLGQFEGKVGEKSRVAFPKRFREALGDKLIITLGFEKSLMIVSEKEWKELLEGTDGKPFTMSVTREVQRFLLGSAAFVELDAKGRFILPEYLRSYARIIDDVLFLGQSRYVEMWDKKRWDTYKTKLEENIEKIAEKLSSLKNDGQQ